MTRVIPIDKVTTEDGEIIGVGDRFYRPKLDFDYNNHLALMGGYKIYAPKGFLIQEHRINTISRYDITAKSDKIYLQNHLITRPETERIVAGAYASQFAKAIAIKEWQICIEDMKTFFQETIIKAEETLEKMYEAFPHVYTDGSDKPDPWPC